MCLCQAVYLVLREALREQSRHSWGSSRGPDATRSSYAGSLLTPSQAVWGLNSDPNHAWATLLLHATGCLEEAGGNAQFGVEVIASRPREAVSLVVMSDEEPTWGLLGLHAHDLRVPYVATASIAGGQRHLISKR